MPLLRVRTWTGANQRLHVVRDRDNEVIGVNCTFRADELTTLLAELEGRGSLNGGWTVLEAARRALVTHGVTEAER